VPLVDRATLDLSGDYKERLGSAFLDETSTPKSLRDVVKDGEREVGLDTSAMGSSRRTGGRAWVGRRTGLRQALHLDPGALSDSGCALR
jgi:hypothetical protein